MQKSPDDDTRLRPRMGSRKGKVAVQRAPRFIQSVLARAYVRYGRIAGAGQGRAPRKHVTRGVADVRQPRIGARRCIVKARIIKMGPHGMKAARLHLSYIERDGVDRDGSPGRLYGTDDTLDRASLAEPVRGERHQFRFIVSPEDDIDLTMFTRQLMSGVESDLGVRLRWGAVNHYDTDNPHAHVVVRGMDRRGHEVRIDRLYLSERMRWRAQNILTDELGPRLEHEIYRQLDREVERERFTSLDRTLETLLAPERTIDMAGIARACGDEQRRRMVGRLRVLEDLQLATRPGPGVWTLALDWQQALRDLGEREDIHRRIYDATKGDVALDRFEIWSERAERDPIVGVVRRKGLDNELRGDFYAVVETARGGAAYVRLHEVAARELQEGSIARVAVERQTWAKPIDRVLELVAGENGGVYDARLHLEQMRRRPVVIQGRTLDPAEVVAANVRRLERLERYSLVIKLEDGRWRLPPDLVKSLEARDLSHPRHMVRAQTIAPPLEQQITRRGPCWLDSLDPNEPRAFFGFGTKRQTALEQREKFLLGLGIACEPREDRMRALERLERHDLGQKLARERGVTLLPSPLPGMRGQLLMLDRNSTREPVAYVLDQVNRRLALVPTPQDLSMIGRRVTLSLGADGRLRMRADGLEMDRGR
jgi:type IV secretory pathway VirD2 relaxase